MRLALSVKSSMNANSFLCRVYKKGGRAMYGNIEWSKIWEDMHIVVLNAESINLCLSITSCSYKLLARAYLSQRFLSPWESDSFSLTYFHRPHEFSVQLAIISYKVGIVKSFWEYGVILWDYIPALRYHRRASYIQRELSLTLPSNAQNPFS